NGGKILQDFFRNLHDPPLFPAFPLKFLRTSEKETNRTPALAVLRLSAGPGAVYWLREGKSTDVIRLKKDRLFGLL
ncbi:MAG: hypothetical protein E6X19_26290, partial [Hungatella hathewayi]|nr:hypothetical protein [Hungatella hathewayi]